ncbi:MAG: LuxR C-terminal-related transcriptional regulator [Propionicimonas sp.]|uniref:helix-turn-helix transcriptional regulator n=1 Tax=Propionicimonas sp. TaxID=1955623 RepID=UPI003D123251
MIVGMLVEAAEALAADVDAEQVVCRYLAQNLEADVAACYVPDAAEGGASATCYPDSRAAAALVRLLEAGADGEASVPTLREHHRLGEVLVVAPGGFTPDGVDGSPHRVLAFAKREGFGDDHVLLLREAVPPLMALLPHVVAARERRGRSRAGLDAARELGLTSRELEVLELLAQGLLATSIASRLELSPRTVHKHLGNIYDKLGVHDRLVAVSMARGRGLVAA